MGYANIFAVMVRLRQLCCHRELLPIKWEDVDEANLIQNIQNDMNSINPMTNQPNNNNQYTPPSKEKIEELKERLRKAVKGEIIDVCAICLDEYDSPVVTPCAHIYCKECIIEFIAGKEASGARPNCPLCMGTIRKTGLIDETHIRDEREENNDPDQDNSNITTTS